MRTEGKKVAEASRLSFSEDQRRDAPSTWPLRKIGDIVSEVRYGTSAKTCEDAAGVPVLRMGNIQNGELDLANLKYLPEAHEEFPKLLLEPGDILFNRTNSAELVGKTAVYRGIPAKCSYASYLIALRLSEGVPEWVAYYLNSPFGKEWVKSVVSQQVGQANVNGTKLKDLEIPFPPLPEQRRIVARIEELFSRLDAGVAALRHAKAQLQRYRQSVLAAAVTGELTREWREQHHETESAEELLDRILAQRREQWNGRGRYTEPVPPNEDFGRNPPNTWEMASMDALTCHITSGSRDWTKYYEDDGYAVFVMAQNVRPLKFDSTPVIRVAPPDGDRDKVRSAVARDDLLVTIVGANTGNVCRVNKSFEDYYVCQSVALMRPVESETAKYLDLYMNSEEHGQDQFNKWMYGQGRPHLSFDQLRSTAVFLPPLAEQHQIVAEVEARTTAIDHLEAELDRQITRSNRLRRSVLAEAFRGGLS